MRRENYAQNYCRFTKSKLALTQTNWFIDQLKALGLPYEFEVKEIVTKGDVILDVTLSK